MITDSARDIGRSLPRRDGLVVLGAAIFASVLTGPGQTIGVSVFIDHLVDDLDITRSQVATMYLIGTLTGSLLLPSVGRFIDRNGVRRAQLLIGIAFGAALVNMSFVTGLVTLAVGFTGIRLLGQGSLSLVSTVTVSLRFDQRRGTAIGIFSTVSAGLMALVPVVLAATIAWVGWRQAWLVAAAVVVTTVVPLAWFGLATMPTASTLTDETPQDAAAVDPAPDADADDFSIRHRAPGLAAANRREALGTRGFWILAATSASAGMLVTALNFHQIDLLSRAGLTDEAAAAMFLPQVIGSTVAGFGFGYLADRVGGRLLPAASMAILAMAHVLAANASPGAAAFGYAIVLGAAGGATRTVTATLLPEWFGTAHLGSIQGTLTFLGVGASALGPVALAVLEERTGSYPVAIMTLAALPVAVLLFGLMAPFPGETGVSRGRRRVRPGGVG